MIKEKYSDFFFLISLFFIVVNQPTYVEFECQLFTQKINLKDNQYKILDDIATLSGNFTDFGFDEDSDGQFDYLVLEIEVDVTVAGTYRVYVWGLKDSSGNIISVSDTNTTYLEVGFQTVQIYLAGQAIYGQGLNPMEIVDIYLYDDSSNKLGELDLQLLSQSYSYTDFKVVATLSGNFTDFGFDEDSDGQFDYLVLEIEVDVTLAGTYRVYVWGLKDSSGNIISVSDTNTTYLEVGFQTVQIYLAGQAIYGQGLNPTEIVDIYLYDDSSNKLGELDLQLLSQSYSYTDFGSDNTFSTTVPSSTAAITTSTDPSSSFTSGKTRSTNTTTITTSTDPSSSFSSEKTELRGFFGLLFSLILIVLVIRHRRKSIP